VTAEHEPAAAAAREHGERVTQALAIARRPRRRRRPFPARLAKRQIDAQRGHPTRGECGRDRAQHG